MKMNNNSLASRKYGISEKAIRNWKKEILSEKELN